MPFFIWRNMNTEQATIRALEQKVQSNLAAILMATTPLSATVLAHFFTQNEKINFTKVFGVLIGFSGVVFLFSDKFLPKHNKFADTINISV